MLNSEAVMTVKKFRLQERGVGLSRAWASVSTSALDDGLPALRIHYSAADTRALQFPLIN